MRYDLPTWLRGVEVTRLKNAFDGFWGSCADWIKTPLQQLDAETCHPVVLQFLAYQQDVERFPTEPDEMFRLRVKHAGENTQDAGSPVRFADIFSRFGAVVAGQIERDPLKDYDVITLVMADGVITKEPELGQFIIRQYGRTCRRYEFLLINYTTPGCIGGQMAQFQGLAHTMPHLDIEYVFDEPTVNMHHGICSIELRQDVARLPGMAQHINDLVK